MMLQNVVSYLSEYTRETRALALLDVSDWRGLAGLALVDISDWRGLAGVGKDLPLATIFAATASVSLVDSLQLI